MTQKGAFLLSRRVRGSYTRDEDPRDRVGVGPQRSHSPLWGRRDTDVGETTVQTWSVKRRWEERSLEGLVHRRVHSRRPLPQCVGPLPVRTEHCPVDERSLDPFQCRGRRTGPSGRGALLDGPPTSLSDSCVQHLSLSGPKLVTEIGIIDMSVHIFGRHGVKGVVLLPNQW